MRDITAIGTVTATAYTIPTDSPEADGTLHWDSTTLVVVEVTGGSETVSVTPTRAAPSPA